MAPRISAAMVARSRTVAEPRIAPDASFVAWVESFGGRADIVTWRSGTPAVVMTADAATVGVGGYGGGAYAVAPDGTIVYACSDGRLLAVPRDGGPPRVLSRDGKARAPAVSPDGTRAAFIVERDDACDIAVVPLDGSAWPAKISAGADYSFDPAWSPDSTSVVWHEWDFPSMPWDGSRIAVCDLASGAVKTVAGGDGIAAGQPRFSPDGAWLAYVCDTTGWTNIWIARPDGGRARPLHEEPREHAEPTWGAGQRSYAWSPDAKSVAFCRNEDGFGRLVVAPVGRGRAREVAKGWHQGIDWGALGILASRSGAVTPPQITITPTDHPDRRAVLARGAVGGFEAAELVEPEAVTWKSDDKATVHGLLYRPRTSALGPGTKPPLYVHIHGGPTSQTGAIWLPRAQYLVERGWAVLVPNYRGSTGHGRAYAQALTGRWGDLDVRDTAAGIRHAAKQRWSDPQRVAVGGGSAGGFTVLLLCARHPELVRAGVDLFGVTDLFDLAATTHRFESRYLDRIVGELPRDADRYREHSPVTHVDAISVPLLVHQGDIDVAVPKAQSDAVVDGLRARGTPVEYFVYEGEGHGFVRPESVQSELERSEQFMTKWVLQR